MEYFTRRDLQLSSLPADGGSRVGEVSRGSSPKRGWTPQAQSSRQALNLFTLETSPAPTSTCHPRLLLYSVPTLL